MKKVIVINGPGTSGKGTFIRTIRAMLSQAGIPVYSFSSIFPIKHDMVTKGEWDEKYKDEDSRNLMISRKAEMIAQGDIPLRYLIDSIKSQEGGVFFVHIREKDEIEKFIETAEVELGIKPLTMHYDREGKEVINTTAENGTREFTNYDYDIVVTDGLSSVREAAVKFVREIVIENFREEVNDELILQPEMHFEFDDELKAGYA